MSWRGDAGASKLSVRLVVAVRRGGGAIGATGWRVNKSFLGAREAAIWLAKLLRFCRTCASFLRTNGGQWIDKPSGRPSFRDVAPRPPPHPLRRPPRPRRLPLRVRRLARRLLPDVGGVGRLPRPAVCGDPAGGGAAQHGARLPGPLAHAAARPRGRAHRAVARGRRAAAARALGRERRADGRRVVAAALVGARARRRAGAGGGGRARRLPPRRRAAAARAPRRPRRRRHVARLPSALRGFVRQAESREARALPRDALGPRLDPAAGARAMLGAIFAVQFAAAQICAQF